jgi:uncharacterized membrane protein
MGVFLLVYGLWVFLPFLAPVFMQIGWSTAGRVIYFVYSFFCHQLPERSFFLFGPKPMYSLSEVQAAWQNTLNLFVLRQFIGNPTMGWKVAWSDRMVSLFTSIWLFAVLWLPVRNKAKPLSWWVFGLLLLPVILDGGSHAISDLAGMGRGFRDSNAWLASLTQHALPVSFYVGDALGSFNSWMRLLTGVLAGFSIAWLAFPYIFQTEVYNRKLEEFNYAKVIEQIKTQNQNPAG